MKKCLMFICILFKCSFLVSRRENSGSVAPACCVTLSLYASIHPACFASCHASKDATEFLQRKQRTQRGVGRIQPRCMPLGMLI